MKRAWYIFKTYYLFSLIFLIILISIFLLTTKNEEDYETIFYSGLFFFLIMFFFSTQDFIKEEYYKPYFVKKKRLISPLSDFKNKGFKKNKNELIGQIGHYTVCVGFEWDRYEKRPNYYSRILFNPLSYGRFLRQDEHEKFNDLLMNNNQALFIDSIYNTYVKKRLLKVKYDDMFNDILYSIKFLKSRKLSVIDYDEWVSYESRVLKHEEKFVY